MIVTNVSGKNIDLDSYIDKIINENRVSEVLFLVPTKRKMRKLKKEIISYSPMGFSNKLNIETIGTLTEKMLSEIKSYIPLSEATATVLLKQAASVLKFSYFNIYGSDIPAGTLTLLRNVISEYKKNGITPDIIKKESESLEGAEKNKASDISAIYEEYRKLCYSLDSYETGDIYIELISNAGKIEEAFNNLYIQVKYFIALGFDEFTFPEIKILGYLKNIRDLEIYLSFDFFEYNNQLFEHLENCRKNLFEAGFIKTDDTGMANQKPFIELIRRKLFRYNQGYFENFSDTISLIEADDREKEILVIGKMIKDLIDNGKVSPEKITLVFNNIGNYSPIVRNVFNALGLPFNLTDRISLDKSQPVIAILNLLSIAETDYYYKAILKALSSGYFSDKIQNIESIILCAVNLGIVNGYDNWIRLLNRNLEKNDENQINLSNATLLNAKKSIQCIEEYIKEFKKELTPGEFLGGIKTLITKLEIPVKLLNTSNDYEESSIKALTVFIESLEEIIQLLEMEKGKDKKYNLHYYLNIIRSAGTGVRFNIKEKSDYGVLVTSLNEIRGLNFDYLFFAGLCDGDFPTRYSPEIFTPERFRKGEKRHQADERYHFYQTLCCWNKRLFLSYPLTDRKAEFEMSVFLQEFLNLVKTKKVDLKEYENKIYSVNELIKNYNFENIKKLYNSGNKELIDFGLDLSDIEEKIEAEKKRFISPFSNNIYNGFVGNNSYWQPDENYIFSVTQLETYARCPYKFFLERVLKIEGEQEPVEEIESLELGSILHDILYEFYLKFTGKKLRLSNCSDEVFHIAVNLMKEIAVKYENNEIINLPLSFFEKEKIFGMESNFDTSLLYKFLEYERNSSEEFEPVYFEESFGFGDQGDPVFEIGGVKLRGKIDRIEINRKNKTFNVVDYKLGGAKPTLEELQKGYSLQLPVYLIAAEKILKEKTGDYFAPAGMFIYSLKYNVENFGRTEVKVSRARNIEIETIREFLEQTEEKINQLADGIRNGKFNLAEEEKIRKKICGYCEYSFICRIKELE